MSTFVEALKTELEATFKEDISVYFDENPHDRLQETHNVDKSLEGKLKFLIFIPILSQTYCDPYSYAWQYEFLAFNKLAKEDRFGRDIKLRNGNYASRGLTNYTSLTPSVAGTISRKLDANVFISGSISQAGATIRVNAQLVNSKTEEAFKSFQIEGTSEEEIFQIIDSLSVLVKDFLVISVMDSEIIADFRWLISTGSSEAYKYYMYGNQGFYKLDWPTARDWYLKATEIDTNFTEALRMLTFTYGQMSYIPVTLKHHMRELNILVYLLTLMTRCLSLIP